jgi:hypothetical protein
LSAALTDARATLGSWARWDAFMVEWVDECLLREGKR